ncbi:MAG: hypothetical protein FJZ88_02895 [Chloroflexi bacterium]|nr:hypothetical protein [Chloroflexota bacterium]
MEDNKLVSAIIIIVVLVALTLAWQRVLEAPEASVPAAPTRPAVFTEELAAPAPSPAAEVTVDARTLNLLRLSMPTGMGPPRKPGPDTVFPTEDAPGTVDPPGVTRYPGSYLISNQENLVLDDQLPPVSTAEYLAKASPDEVRSFYVELYTSRWGKTLDHLEPDGSAWWGNFVAPDGQNGVSILSLDVSDESENANVEPVTVIQFVFLPQNEGELP